MYNGGFLFHKVARYQSYCILSHFLSSLWSCKSESGQFSISRGFIWTGCMASLRFYQVSVSSYFFWDLCCSCCRRTFSAEFKRDLVGTLDYNWCQRGCNSLALVQSLEHLLVPLCYVAYGKDHSWLFKVYHARLVASNSWLLSTGLIPLSSFAPCTLDL